MLVYLCVLLNRGDFSGYTDVTIIEIYNFSVLSLILHADAAMPFSEIISTVFLQ